MKNRITGRAEESAYILFFNYLWGWRALSRQYCNAGPYSVANFFATKYKKISYEVLLRFDFNHYRIFKFTKSRIFKLETAMYETLGRGEGSGLGDWDKANL